MQNQKPKLSYWFITAGTIWLVLALAHLYYTKTEVFFYLHGEENTPFDYIMYLGTHLGDGWVVLPVFVFLFFKESLSKALAFGLAFGFSGLITQVLKRTVFKEIQRPSSYLGEDLIRTVDWVDLHSMHSFPSGHTTAAFALCLSLAFIYRNKYAQIGFALLAWFIGYTRVYIGQHFPVDLLGGAVVGILITVLIFTWERKWPEKLKYRPL